MFRVDSKHHQVVVAESDLRDRSRLGMDDSGVSRPGLTGILQMPLHTSPAVPGQQAVETNQNKGEKNEKDNCNLGNFDEVMTKIIDDRCVEIVAKCDPTLLRNRKTIWIKRQREKGIVDVFL